jgi:transposase InsO family protein
VIQCDFFVENGYFRYGSLSDNREPFNGRLRDELLNETLFGSLANVRAALTEWQLDCNTVSPPGSLGNLPPGRLRQAQRPASQRDRDAARDRGLCPIPLQHRANQGQMANRLYSSVDEKPGSGRRG